MASKRGLSLAIFGVVLLATNAQNPDLNQGGNNQIHRRFEYKYSFKPPYLAQKDGTVPFFEYSGSMCFNFSYFVMDFEY